MSTHPPGRLFSTLPLQPAASRPSGARGEGREVLKPSTLAPTPGSPRHPKLALHGAQRREPGRSPRGQVTVSQQGNLRVGGLALRPHRQKLKVYRKAPAQLGQRPGGLNPTSLPEAATSDGVPGPDRWAGPPGSPAPRITCSPQNHVLSGDLAANPRAASPCSTPTLPTWLSRPATWPSRPPEPKARSLSSSSSLPRKSAESARGSARLLRVVLPPPGCLTPGMKACNV